MRLNNTEKYLFGASSAMVGLGLQKLLPVEYQLIFSREALIGLGISIPLVYYLVYTLIVTLKGLKNLIEEKLDRDKGRN